MAYNLLLNNKVFHFAESGLPCLVHYKNKTGGSHFTVTLVADMFLRGSKILFLTAYPMAKDNFFEQTKGKESKIFFVETKDDFKKAKEYQAIILKSGDGNLYLEALKSLPDLNERVVLVKNFEVFDKNILDESLKLEKIIVSGDIDKSSSKKLIADKLYKTIISFSQPETSVSFITPALLKYTGYLKTADKEGFVKLEM
ncbi:MAG: hypothetical protein V1867_05365 [Candidatus Falkowbacteria bacterium]